MNLSVGCIPFLLDGLQINCTDFDDLVKKAFGIEEKYIFEGYSMTEMNVSLMRCPAGRYHLPPLVEPVIYDEALKYPGPRAGK